MIDDRVMIMRHGDMGCGMGWDMIGKGIQLAGIFGFG